jgi:hypothetical protein
MRRRPLPVEAVTEQNAGARRRLRYSAASVLVLPDLTPYEFTPPLYTPLCVRLYLSSRHKKIAPAGARRGDRAGATS